MIILASRSLARMTLLENAGLRVTAMPAPLDERAAESAAIESGATGAQAIATALAGAKALAVARARPGAVVVGADQVLVIEGRRLHKPETLLAARSQLDLLRGRTHLLYAAVALATGDRIVWSGCDRAELTMRDFSAAERDAVLAAEGEALLGSVGGYRLEGPSIRLFSAVRGDYFTILGLPLLPLLEALRRHAPEVFEERDEE